MKLFLRGTTNHKAKDFSYRLKNGSKESTPPIASTISSNNSSNLCKNNPHQKRAASISSKLTNRAATQKPKISGQPAPSN
jgi:hypothetical protein